MTMMILEGAYFDISYVITKNSRMLNSNHLFQDSFIFVLIRDVDATNFKYFLYSNKGSASHLQIPH